jgi:hypothetical protein
MHDPQAMHRRKFSRARRPRPAIASAHSFPIGDLSGFLRILEFNDASLNSYQK